MNESEREGESPVLSIIVPIFNTSVYLEACLSSLLKQTFDRFELICVDNGSTDGSWERLKRIQNMDDRIIALSHPEGKQGAARNAGLKIARGQYIGFVDSDDYVDSEMFNLLVSKASQYSADIAVCGTKAFVESSGAHTSLVDHKQLDYTGVFNVEDNPKQLRNTTAWNKIYRRSFIERNNLRFPPDRFYEDIYFVAYSLLLSERIVAVPKDLYFYRKERTDSTTTDRGRNIFDLLEIVKMLSVGESSFTVERKSLLHEAVVCKFLMMLKASLASPFLGEFYREVQQCLSAVRIGVEPVVLTRSEMRELYIARNSSVSVYRGFVRIERFCRRVVFHVAMRLPFSKGLGVR